MEVWSEQHPPRPEQGRAGAHRADSCTARMMHRASPSCTPSRASCNTSSGGPPISWHATATRLRTPCGTLSAGAPHTHHDSAMLQGLTVRIGDGRLEQVGVWAEEGAHGKEGPCGSADGCQEKHGRCRQANRWSCSMCLMSTWQLMMSGLHSRCPYACRHGMRGIQVQNNYSVPAGPQ